MELCSIIVPVFNNLAYNRLFFEHLPERTDFPYELIVVDNGSTDGTRDLVDSVPGARVIRFARNQGVPKAWNAAIREANGDCVAILNNDIVLPPRWLAPLVAELDDSALGIVHPVERFAVVQHPEVFGTDAGILSLVPQSVPRGRTPSKELVDSWYGGDFDAFTLSFRVRHASARLPGGDGACMIVRRTLFGDIGLFEERFGMAYYEDVDFFYRTSKNRRWSGQRTHGGILFHHFQRTSQSFLPPGELERASRAFFTKNPDW